MKQENVGSLEYWLRMFGLDPRKFTLTDSGVLHNDERKTESSSRGLVGMRTRVGPGKFRTKRDPNLGKGHGSVHGEGTGRRESQS